MSEIFTKSYAAQQARESAVSTSGQPSTTDGNLNQSPTATRSAEGAPNRHYYCLLSDATLENNPRSVIQNFSWIKHPKC